MKTATRGKKSLNRRRSKALALLERREAKRGLSEAEMKELAILQQRLGK